MNRRHVVVQGPGSGGPSLRGGGLELWHCKDREVALSGPAETGKTFACCFKLHCLLLAYPGAQAVVVRKVRDTMHASVLSTYRKKVLAEDSGVRVYGGEKAEWFDYPNGSRLWVAGMDNPGKALSSERDFVYVNQAEELNLEDWETLTTRATGRAGNSSYPQVMADCNPGPPHHWLKQRQTMRMIESRHEDNPVLWDGSKWTEQGIRTLAALDALTGVRKERLRYGRWVSAEGTVYNFDPLVHVVKRGQVPPCKLFMASVDWGLRNPGVLQVWGVDGDGRMYLVREVYRTGMLIEWWVEQAKQAKTMYPIECFVCDPSEPAYIEQFMRAGLYAVGAVNEIVSGIQAVEARLAVQRDGRPRLMLVDGCLTERDESLAQAHKPVCLRAEFDAYMYPKGADGRPVKETPVKENDHSCDAARYAVMWADQRQNVGSETLRSGGGRPCVPPGEQRFDARRPPQF